MTPEFKIGKGSEQVIYKREYTNSQLTPGM